MVVDSSSLLLKYLGEKEGNSLKFMQRMIYLIFSEVVYQRELLPQEHFTEKKILGCTLHIPNISIDRRQLALHNHLKGAAEAISGKRLKQFNLMVHKDQYDPSAADEVFIMDVVYAEDEDEASMQMSCGDQPEVRVHYTGADELQKQTREVFKCLTKGLSTLDRITRNVSFSFYIMYRDGVDRSYHPAGYGQAPRPYALSETAEIGDMGMLHAKEHACLLKVKSNLLEDGFQLMQANAATQRSLQSADPSQESSSDQASSDKTSSLGVFAYHDEFEETPEEEPTRRDQRSLTAASAITAQFEQEEFEETPEERPTRRDQRSLTAASARTMRFERSDSADPSIRSNESMDVDSSDDASIELGTATKDDFLTTPPTSQTTVGIEERRKEDTTQERSNISFASTVTMVTKKLVAADKRKQEKESLQTPKPAVATSSGRSHSSTDAGSEASSEDKHPVRRVSQRRRKSLPKIPEVSCTTSSDGKSTEESVEDAEVRAPTKVETSGKDADTEPSEDTVEKKVPMERRRSARRKTSIERPMATVSRELMKEPENEAAPSSQKRQRLQRGGRKSKDAAAPDTPVESTDTDTPSSERKGRRRAMAKKEEAPKRGGTKEKEKDTVVRKSEEPAESPEVNKSTDTRGKRDTKEEKETPMKRPRAEEPSHREDVKRTPGEGIKRSKLFSQR